MKRLEDLIGEYASLTRTQRQIFGYMMDHRLEMGYLSLREVAAQACSSEVSVLNLCGTLGFQSFTELREAFRADTAQVYQSGLAALPRACGDSALDLSVKEKIRQFCLNEYANMNRSFEQLDMDVLHQCARALSQAREVFVFGHDASKIPADYLAQRLNFLQIRAQAVKLGDDDTVQVLLAKMTKEDYVIFFSFPPYHMPSQEIAGFVKHRGVPIITITDSKDSPVVVEGSLNLLCMTHTPFFFNALSVPMAFIEILVCCIASEMGDKLDAIINAVNNVSNFININGHKNRTNGRNE